MKLLWYSLDVVCSLVFCVVTYINGAKCQQTLKLFPSIKVDISSLCLMDVQTLYISADKVTYSELGDWSYFWLVLTLQSFRIMIIR